LVRAKQVKQGIGSACRVGGVSGDNNSGENSPAVTYLPKRLRKGVIKI